MLRSVSVLLFSLAFAAGLAAPPPGVARAAEPGASCEEHEALGWIFCTVTRDGFSVKAVSLDGGACPSPIPTDADAQRAQHFDRLLATGNRSLTRNMPPMQNIPSYYAALCEAPDTGQFPGHPRTECPSFLASQKLRFSPLGTYRAGDRFRVATFECRDATEMSIDTDAGAESWRFAE